MSSTSYCPEIRPTDWCDREPGLDWLAERPKNADRGKLRLIDEAVAKAVSIAQPESLEERLREQADKWEAETSHLSSPTQRIAHLSYQAILGIGLEHRDETLRFLLHDMQQNRRAWFWALSYLAQDNPIRATDVGKMDRMIDAWVGWGRKKGLL